MPLIPCKCTQCGAKLEIEGGIEAAVCPFCKTPFIVEKAINNYKVSVNQMHANVVNVVNDAADTKLRSADAYLKMCDYDKALNDFKKITQEFAFEYRGWVGYARCVSRNFTWTSPSVVGEVRNCYQRAMIVASDEDKGLFEKDFRNYFNLVERRQGLIDTELQRKQATFDRECLAINENTKQIILSVEKELRREEAKLDALKSNSKRLKVFTGVCIFLMVLCIILTLVSLYKCVEETGEPTMMIVFTVIFFILLIARRISDKAGRKNITKTLKQEEVVGNVQRRLKEEESAGENKKNSLASFCASEKIKIIDHYAVQG